MPQLIALIMWVVLFALVGYGLWLVCTKFLNDVPPARWFAGAFLMIAILVWVAKVINSGIPILINLT